MDPETANLVFDFLDRKALPEEKIHIGFFGGEPLLVLPLVIEITRMLKNHRLSQKKRT